MCFYRKYKIIAPKLNITTKELVVSQKLRRKGIKFGTKLVVPRNFVFATVKNGKVLDVLERGEYILTTKTLPETVRKLQLFKPNKKNKCAKFAPVQAYFVNLNDFDETIWQTNGKVELEDKKYLIYKITADGKYNFKISNPEKFLKYLISEVVELDSVSAANTFSNLVNTKITEIFNDKNYGAEELYFKDSKITNDLFIEISKLLTDKGVSLDGITLENVIFPPKTLKKLEKLDKLPRDSQGTGTSAFEDWQASNPVPEKKGPQFVTIEPAKKGSKNFFKESMAPYFFAEEEEAPEEEVIKPKIKSKWMGPIEKAKLEKAKSFVNLNDDNE